MSLLDMWLHGRRIAVLDDTAGMGMASLKYTQEALDTYGTGGLALSVRLRVREEPYSAYETRNWIDGLLPEDKLRTALANQFRVDETDAFGLLAQIGRECAGAITVTEAGAEHPVAGGVTWLDEDGLVDAVRKLASAPLGISADNGVRVSLGGVQEKLVLVQGPDGRLGLPRGATPSTHILKPSPYTDEGIERWPGVVHGELYAMRVLKHAGIPAADVTYRRVGQRPALLVRRYDRVEDGGVLRRVHQEDMCQALGLPPGSKYQKGTDPLTPSLRAVAAILWDNAAAPVRELEALHEQVVASLVLGNSDQHAKNLSILVDRDGARLAPAYDVVPTRALDLDPALGLSVGGQFLSKDITGATIEQEAALWNLSERGTRRWRLRVLEALREALTSAYTEVADEASEHPIMARVHREAMDRLSAMR